MTPSYFEHSDLMQILIAGLILLVCWFIKREFARFDTKLTEACDAIKGKTDKTETDQIWERVNSHGHSIVCDVDKCKPKTTAVIIHEVH